MPAGAADEGLALVSLARAQDQSPVSVVTTDDRRAVVLCAAFAIQLYNYANAIRHPISSVLRLESACRGTLDRPVARSLELDLHWPNTAVGHSQTSLP